MVDLNPLPPHTQVIQPQIQLITVKLNDDNYLVWRQQVLTTIRGYGLEGFLDGSSIAPDRFIPAGEPGLLRVNPEYTAWQRQDQLLASWILSSLSESILVSMVGLNNSYDMWQCLEVNFSSQSKARIMQHKVQLQNLKKGSLNMREYLNKVKACCDTLAAAGQKLSEEDQILHILAGLGSEYDAVMVSITSKTEPFSLKDVSSLLLSYESRLETTNQVSVEASLPSANIAVPNHAKRGNFIPQFGRGRASQQYHRGGRGGGRGYRGRGGRFNNGRPQCQVCHIFGHTADKCYHRFDASYIGNATSPQNQRGYNDGSGNYNQATAMFAAQDNATEFNWYPDSGASNHVTNELSNLNLAADYHGQNKLQIGNGSGLDICHVGNSIVSSFPHKNRNTHLFKLDTLLHVPQITKNLLSVAQFAKDNGVFFEFHPLHCVVKDQVSGEVLLKGNLRNGLYQFKLIQLKLAANTQESSATSSQFQHKQSFSYPVLSSRESRSVAYVANSAKGLHLWHKRLGHPSYEIVKKALNYCNLPYINENHDFPCSSCLKAKCHKLPFTDSETTCKELLEIVHTDLWGPAPLKSSNGFIYYVAFVDEYSKYVWLFLLKHKSDVYSAFIQFKNLAENQSNKRIKMIQSDGGTEFKGLTKLFQENGIVHRISCPYTPEQNGTVERKHRHIVEVGLSLLAQSGLPYKFWDDAFVTATYLINRIPNKNIKFLSPLEMLLKQKPSYSHLKAFGCLCFPLLRPYNKHKLEFRSDSGTFIGYSNQFKGYKVLLPNGKIIFTRHVVFNELVFPNLVSQPSRSSLTPQTTISHPPFVSTLNPPFDPNLPPLTESPPPNHDHTNSVILGTPHSDTDHSIHPTDSPIIHPDAIELPTGYDPANNIPDVPRDGTVHPMITRSKAGIFKPKVYITHSVEDAEPNSVEEALNNSK